MPNPRRELQSGMFIEARLATAVRPDAVVIPEDAVIPLQGTNFVWVVADGKASRRQVELGGEPGGVEAPGVGDDLDAALQREAEAAFGDLALGGFEPGGVKDGHMEGSAHYEGRAIDVFVRPVNTENNKRGWAIAQYLVAQADRLSIETVIFDDRIWKAGSRSGDGWRDYDAPQGSGDRAVLEHRDHVHVDVFR